MIYFLFLSAGWFQCIDLLAVCLSPMVCKYLCLLRGVLSIRPCVHSKVPRKRRWVNAELTKLEQAELTAFNLF